MELNLSFIQGSGTQTAPELPAKPVAKQSKPDYAGMLKRTLQRQNKAYTDEELLKTANAAYQLAEQAKQESSALHDEYCRNQQQAQGNKAAVLTGLLNHESPTDLLLVACEAIALMTGDNGFYEQAQHYANV